MSVRSLGWCFTLNNYTADDFEAVKLVECSYVVVGKEVGDSGTPHLQGFIQFAKPGKTFAAVRKLVPLAHWEMTKGSVDDNYVYCTKAGDFFEKGVKPMSQSKKNDVLKRSLEQRWSLAKAGRFEELPPECIKTYEYIYRKNLVVVDRADLDNLWIVGVSGSGKSRYVRETYSVFYSKPMSKWWDGYAGEDVVVLDDFDPGHGKFLAYFLKIWADHYAFNAEVKGGMMKIRPKSIVVTSQYNISSCFESSEDVAAISRRFKLKVVGSPVEDVGYVYSDNFKPYSNSA